MGINKNDFNITNNITINNQSNAELDKLKAQMEAIRSDSERLTSQLSAARAEASALAEELSSYKHGNGIEILESELERFRNTAEQSTIEFRNFLESVNLNDGWGHNDWQFDGLFDQIRDGSITAAQAITKVKTEFRALMEENYNNSGGLFDSQMVQSFTASMERLGETIGTVLTKIENIEQNGVRAIGEAGSSAGGTGGIADVLKQIEKATAGMSEEAKAAYEPITNLVKSIVEYGNIDSTKILGISQAFRNIADIGTGSYGSKSIENIVYLAKQLQALSSGGGGAIRFDFTGFNDLKVSKASVSNLATYLPQIASVNTSKLEKLSQINLTNFNDIKVSKSSIENISKLTEAIQVLREVKAATVKDNGDSISVDAGEKAVKEASHYKDAARSVKEYYSLLIQLSKSKSDVTLTSEGWVSESGQWNELAAALNRTKTAFDLYTNSANNGNLTSEEQINLLRLVTAESQKYVLAVEQQANKEREAAEAAAAKAQKQQEEAAAKAASTAASQQAKAQAEAEAKAKREAAQAAKDEANAEKERTKEKNDAERASRQVASIERSAIIALNQGEKALRDWTSAEHSVHSSSRTAYEDLRAQVKILQEVRQKYINGAASVDDLRDAENGVRTSLKNTENILRANGDATKTFGERIGSLAAKFSTWFSITRVVMGAVRTVKQMVSASIELDDAMTQLQIVTKENDIAMQKFGETAADTSKKIGSSIGDFVDSATTYARLGYTLEESSMLAEYTAMLQNVGDIDVGDAQDAITSIVKAFDVNTADIESIMDKLVKTGNNFPISVSQIAEGMNNASSALSAAGNSFEQSVALLTAANTTIQDAAKSSTGLRTIAARIRNTKTELDDLGETMSTAEYEELVKNLTDYNVALTDSNNEYRSTYDIMSDIASQWGKMSSMEQAALATAMSGTRQQAVFYSIIEQFQEASGAMDAMANSSGELYSAYSAYMDSATAHVNQFKAAFKELSANFVQSDFIIQVVDFGTKLLGIMEAIAKMNDALGGLNNVLFITVGIIATIKVDSIVAFIAKIGKSIKSLGETIYLLGLEFVDSFKAAKAAGATNLQAISAGFDSVTASASAAQIAVAAFVAIIAIINIVSNAIENARQDTIALNQELANEQAAIVDNSDALIEAYAKYQKYNAMTERTAEQEVEFNNSLDSVISAIEGKTTALDGLTKGTKDYADALDGVVKKELENAKIAAAQERDAAAKALKSTSYSSWDGSQIKAYYGGSATKNTDEKNLVESIMGEYKTEKWMSAFGNAAADYYLDPNTDDADDIVSFYYKLIELRNELTKQNMMEGSSYNNVVDSINTLKSSVEAYVQAKYDEYAANYKVENGIPSTIEEYNKYKQSLIDSLKGDFNMDDNTLSSIVDSFLNEEGIINSISSVTDEVVDDSGRVKKKLSDLSESITELKSNYEILADAQQEVASGDGLSPDTIKAMADATDDYLDYLYEENGIIKLNEEAWKEFSNAKMVDNIQAIQDEISFLEEENVQLEENIAKYKESQALGNDGGLWSGKIAEATAKLNENNDAIDANQAKLSLYEGTYNNLTGSLDAYTSALQNFTTVNDYISQMSDSLTTVADLQEEVANGFTMSLEKALEFAAVYPEILNNASVAADGQITLDENIVNSFIEGKEAELRADIDAMVKKIENKKSLAEAEMAFAQAQIDLIESGDSAAEAKIASAQIIAQAMIDAGADEANAYEAATAAMSGDMDAFNEAAAKVASDVNTNMSDASKIVADDMYTNMYNAVNSINDVAKAAQNAALAVSGISSGKVLGSSGTGHSSSGGTSSKQIFTVDEHGFDAEGNFTYTSEMKDASEYLAELTASVEGYKNSIAQYNGQIALLNSLGTTSLNKFSSSYKKSSSGSGSGSSSSEKDDTPTWFETQYKLHKHLLAMEAEDESDYLDWLNSAYKQAYNEGIIELDDYYKYQEEVFSGLKDLFKDYLSDVEHEISMRKNYDGEAKKIISLYKTLISKVEAELQAAYARGLDDTDDYVQELLSKWQGYKDGIKDIQDDIEDNAKDAVDDLIDYVQDMQKQEIEDQKDALDKKLDNLKEFYDKQKEMLEDARDEEKYLDEQAEKRKSVTDIQAELARLEYDNSAWAQKRKAELKDELVDAQKELDEFEKDRALDLALDAIEESYNAQEAQIQAEMDALDAELNNPELMFNKALAAIQTNTGNLYQQMLEFNRKYGTGNDEDVKDKYEEAYKALLEYKKLNGKDYNGVTLTNATGYKSETGSYDSSKPKASTPTTTTTPKSTTPTTTTTPTLDDATKRKVAAAIWNGGYGWGTGSTRSSRLTEVFGANNGIQALVNKNVGRYDSAPGNSYTYLNMRKKFKGYASGTKNALAGLAQINELGDEAIFQSKDGNTYKLFSGGEKVLNAKATDFLYEFANGGSEILEKVIKSALGGGLFDKISPIINNNEVNMGDIIVQGSATSQTVSEIRREQREAVKYMLTEFQKLNK